MSSEVAFAKVCVPIENMVELDKLELSIGEIGIPQQWKVHKTHCDHCGLEILVVWQEGSTWPLQGVQLHQYQGKFPRMLRMLAMGGERLELSNSFARVHMRPPSHSHPLKINDGMHMLLCDRCFRQTYTRELVQLDDGTLLAVSVVKQWGETLNSVLKSLHVDGKRLGKGSVKEY